ncbi:MAG: TlpA family protein disulfide reductase [Candidatus Aminicenantes bacterium]|nr:MAG: TlpA family protein disulfide reductase [Candidatus Aminicenantes bacterium]
MLLKTSIVISIIIILLLSPLESICQVAKISPEKPKWDDKIEVIYDPTAESAKFLPGDEIYTVYFVYFANSSEKRWAKMRKDEEVFKYQMTVEEDIAFLTFYFITLEDWDRNVSVSAMVYRRDGFPARGAYLNKMTSPFLDEKYLEFFKKELELYADNYAAYRDKWFVQGAFEPDTLENVVKQDIALLKQQVKDESVDLLYSLSNGYMILGEEEKSRNILRKMVDKHPQSFYTGQAFDSYEYQAFSKQIKGEGPEEVEKMKLELIKKSLESRYSREKSLYLARQEKTPITLVEAICESWLKDEPDHPKPYFSLATAYSKRKKKLNRAAELIDRAINLLLQGKLRLYEDVSGTRTKMELPLYYQVSSDIQFQLGNYGKALADIKTAKSMQEEPRPEYHIREATIWQKAGSFQKAEQAYLEALRLGSEEAKDFLKAIYMKRHENLDGFEEYIARRTETLKPESSEEKEKAPDFEVVTLDGKKLRLSDLKGKAVVLNFWFIGCAPCRVEIPGLNNLTEEFKEKDVVFIAFALDKEKNLKSFLQETPFKYQIVPNAGKIADQFRVRAYPTHIIINKEGRVEFRLMGGSENRHEQLRPLIVDVLK